MEWDAEPFEEPVPTRASGLPGIGTAAVAFVAGVALSFGIAAVGDDHLAVELLLLASSAGLWVCLLAGVAIARRRTDGDGAEDIGFRSRWSDIGYGIAASLVARFLAIQATAPIPLPSRSLDDVERDVAPEVLDGAGDWVLLVLAVVIGAPIVEELCFRGIVQRRLVARYRPVVGIGVASLLFGAAHLIAWDGVFTLAVGWSIAVAGIVLGATYHLTGRLGTAIATHAAFNLQVVLALWAFG